jgi:hypothetical protein
MGKTEKAREVLNRFKESSAARSLEIDRIQQVLEHAPVSPSNADETLTADNKEQLLALALSLADRTL